MKMHINLKDIISIITALLCAIVGIQGLFFPQSMQRRYILPYLWPLPQRFQHGPQPQYILWTRIAGAGGILMSLFILVAVIFGRHGK
jgi:hypothetical protein